MAQAQLRSVPHDPDAITAPSPLADAIASGDELAILRARRDLIVEHLAGAVAARDIPPLDRRLAEIMEAIAAIESAIGDGGPIAHTPDEPWTE